MSNRRRSAWLAGALCVGLLASGAWAQEDPFGGWADDPNEEPDTNAQLFERSDSGNVARQAMMDFVTGDRELKRARKLEKKLAKLDGEKREKAEAEISVAYEKAAGAFEEAIRTNPRMVEAYRKLGEALRGTGKFAESLQVTAQGLKLEPGNDDLFHGWAESLLGLNLLGDATQTYTRLRESNPQRAAILMDEMKEWLVVRQADPGDLPVEAVTRLEEWIAEQEGTG